MGRDTEQRKAFMRQSIMNTVKANGIPVSGELWITLIFRSESELKTICSEMNIKQDA